MTTLMLIVALLILTSLFYAIGTTLSRLLQVPVRSPGARRTASRGSRDDGSGRGRPHELPPCNAQAPGSPRTRTAPVGDVGNTVGRQP